MRKDITCESGLIEKSLTLPAAPPDGLVEASPSGILKYRRPEPMSGQIIGRIASSHCFIEDDGRIEDLLKEMNIYPSVISAGVVDKKGTIVGVITRGMFFDILGRPFGRDLYKNKQIHKITSTVRHFNYSDNIFSVADEISSDLLLNRDVHYALTDGTGAFFGVFTNRDLLIYLSYLTTRDLAFAKNIQSCIINEETVIRNEHCEMLAATKMAKDVGGDYYTLKKYSDREWFVAVCDVAGKGISASLLSALLGGINHMYNFTREGIRQYIEKLNDYICSSLKSEKFITGIFIDFNEATGHATVYDAGHSFIFLVRKKKIVRLNEVTENLPIGVLSDYKPVSYRVGLKKNDILVVFTDGIEDQTNTGGAKYGPDRLLKFFTNTDDENLKIIKDSIFHDIRKFRDGQTQDDDMTILMLRYSA